MVLKETPLIEEHKRLGARLAPFGGWLMPIQYSGIIAEHMWTRREASIFDICHMGEFIIHADADDSGLNRIVTFDLNKLKVGDCKYGFILNEAGGIIDDLIVYRTGAKDWMVVVNAATTDTDEAHFRKHLSNGADFQNVSAALGKLDLQGPRSLDVVKQIVGNEIEKLSYYKFKYFNVLGEKIIISRTGYTGELGYELYMNNEKIVKLWNTLLADNRVRPAGLGARDTLRLEMCYPLYGQDITAETTPLEADKRRFVDLNKDFIGKAALVRKGKPSKMLVNFISESRRAPRHNYKIFMNGKEIGVVTSGSFSPSLSCGIGIGYVNAYCAASSKIVLKEDDIEIAAFVTNGPFYRNGTAKILEDSHAGTG
jgi:aminomethyltransferase